jgi:hypothetical protein
MNCEKILDMFYEDDEMPIINQLQISLHAFLCPSCAEKFEKYETARSAMKEYFNQQSAWPDLEESIMSGLCLEQPNEEENESSSIPGVLSTRRWVIAGLILMVSLATVFFGLDFKKLASESGMSFLLPMGITIGIVLTTYGALFIGSHLKELSERFGL